MAGIEDSPEKPDLTPDPNAGTTMLDFVRKETGIKPEPETKSNAQELGETEEHEEESQEEVDARLAKEKVDKEREEALANETPEEKEEREQKERDAAEEKARKEKEEGEEKEGETKEDDTKPKDPVPYERFEEVNNKYKVTAEEYEKIKPLAESHVQIQEYCNQWGITQDQFRNLLDIQRLLNTDPAEALKRILPIVEQVQGFTGDKLPADLQKEVDLSQLSLERAREIAKLRAQNTFGGQRFEQFQQMQQQKAQQQFQADQVKAINAWVQGKAKTDLDFKPRKDPKDPKGRFEFVYDAMQSMLAERDEKGQLVHQIRTPQDVPKLLEQAYQEVVRSLAPLSKKPATRKNLSHNGSTGRNTEVKIENAKSMAEAVRIAAAAHGI